MKNNKDIEDAVVTVKEMSEEEELQMLADLRLKAIMDEKSIYAAGVDDGIKEGEVRGEAKGIAKGKAIGEATGIAKIVKALLKNNMSVEDIQKFTNLSKEEIEKIKQSNT